MYGFFIGLIKLIFILQNESTFLQTSEGLVECFLTLGNFNQEIYLSV